MNLLMFPSALRRASRGKELTRRQIDLLSLCAILGTFKPLELIRRCDYPHHQDIYQTIWRLRDSGYLELSRKGTEKGFRRVSGLYRITPKGKKFMADFIAEMERIAERLEHGY